MGIKRKTITGLCMLLSVLMTFCAVGCDSKTETETELASMLEKFKAEIPKAANSDTLKSKNYKIGSVNMGMNGEWYSEVMNGIWDASQDLGVTAMMLDSEGDMEKERDNIRRLVDDGIDALVISPRDSTDSIEALKPAIDSGIPIITWNTSVNTDVTSFVCVDSKALGGDTGDYMCEYIKTYGLRDINLIIIDNKNYDVGIARCDGFKSSIKTMVDQGIIKIVAEDDAETFDTSVELTSKLLREHPEANVIWAWNQPSLLGTIEAVRRSDRQDILIMGTDMSMELADDMLGDEVRLLAVTTQLPYNMGYKAVTAAVDALNGKPVDKTILIPLITYTRNDRELVKRYIKANENLVEWKGGQWYE